MTRAPTFEDIFEVMSKASVGEFARVEVPERPDLEHVPTRFAIALNLLLDDLAEQAEEARRNAAVAAEAEARRRRFEIERLEEVNQLKSRIINTSAHEFNTPLTPLLLQARLLSDGTLGPLSDRQRGALLIMERTLDHIARLVRDMLDVARLQDGRLRLQVAPGDLGALALEAAEAFREQARVTGVAIEARSPQKLPVAMDAQRIQQVLFNLLANALRATPPGGRVRVDVAREKDAAVVCVRDTGIGLGPEQVAMLFQPFSQVHADTRREQAGSGLGLFISKGIVDQHGGRLWCESEGPGKGATFYLALPLRGASGA